MVRPPSHPTTSLSEKKWRRRSSVPETDPAVPTGESWPCLAALGNQAELRAVAVPPRVFVFADASPEKDALDAASPASSLRKNSRALCDRIKPVCGRLVGFPNGPYCPGTERGMEVSTPPIRKALPRLNRLRFRHTPVADLGDAIEIAHSSAPPAPQREPQRPPASAWARGGPVRRAAITQQAATAFADRGVVGEVGVAACADHGQLRCFSWMLSEPSYSSMTYSTSAGISTIRRLAQEPLAPVRWPAPNSSTT